jgi:hypothetical protein
MANLSLKLNGMQAGHGVEELEMSASKILKMLEQVRDSMDRTLKNGNSRYRHYPMHEKITQIFNLPQVPASFPHTMRLKNDLERLLFEIVDFVRVRNNLINFKSISRMESEDLTLRFQGDIALCLTQIPGEQTPDYYFGGRRFPGSPIAH